MARSGPGATITRAARRRHHRQQAGPRARLDPLPHVRASAAGHGRLRSSTRRPARPWPTLRALCTTTAPVNPRSGRPQPPARSPAPCASMAPTTTSTCRTTRRSMSMPAISRLTPGSGQRAWSCYRPSWTNAIPLPAREAMRSFCPTDRSPCRWQSGRPAAIARARPRPLHQFLRHLQHEPGRRPVAPRRRHSRPARRARGHLYVDG